MDIQNRIAEKPNNQLEAKSAIKAPLSLERVIDQSHMKLLDIHHELEVLISLVARSDEKSRSEVMANFAPTIHEAAQAIESVAQDLARLPRR
jgi:hypothetical protein